MKNLINLLVLFTALFFLQEVGPISAALVGTGQGTAPEMAAGSGTLKFKVGVVFKNGDVRPAARTDFYLTSKASDEILQEAAMIDNVNITESFNSYVDHLNISKELKDWIKKNSIRKLHEYSYIDISSQAARAVTIDDFFTIPEFNTWLQHPIVETGGFANGPPPKYPSPNKDQHKQDDAMAKFRTELAKRMKVQRSPNYWIDSMFRTLMVPSWDYAGEMTARVQRLQPTFLSLVKKYAVGQTKTSLNGDAEIPNLKAGQYFLTNAVPTQIGISTILWDLPISVKSGEATQIELSNDNAKKITQN